MSGFVCTRTEGHSELILCCSLTLPQRESLLLLPPFWHLGKVTQTTLLMLDSSTEMSLPTLETTTTQTQVFWLGCLCLRNWPLVFSFNFYCLFCLCFRLLHCTSKGSVLLQIYWACSTLWCKYEAGNFQERTSHSYLRWPADHVHRSWGQCIQWCSVAVRGGRCCFGST